MADAFDDAVVGAGIVGLAHAYALARRGRRVAVFERDARPVGASIRNFGMLWPIGQPPGPLHRLACRSLEIWTDVLRRADLWSDPAGSLHLAYGEDEFQVIREYAAAAPGGGVECALLSPGETLRRAPYAVEAGLRGALWSPREINVDPAQVLERLPAWLARELGVRFFFGCAVTACEPPLVLAGGREFRCRRAWICPGRDRATLFPGSLAGLVPCKLQMLRARPPGGRAPRGPMLAAGLTLGRYAAFEHCPTQPALRARLARELPAHDRFGIHVLAARSAAGEWVLGDSHEYGEAAAPFDNPEIDRLILAYLASFLAGAAELSVTARWHGTYVGDAEHPWIARRPAPGVTLVAGLGGAGMTLSFGLAESVVAAGPD